MFEAVAMATTCKGHPLVPFIHQVGGHRGILLYDRETVSKPAIERELENYRYLAPVLGDFMPKFKGIVEVVIEKDHNGHVTYTAVTAPSITCNESTDEESSSNVELESVDDSNNHGNVSGTGDRSAKQTSFSQQCCSEGQCNRCSPLPSISGISDYQHQHSQGDAVSGKVFKDATTFSFFPLGRGLNPWSLRCHQKEVQRLNMADTQPCKIHANYMLLENITANYLCPSIMDLKIGTRCYGDDLSEEKKQLNIVRVTESTSGKLGVRIGGMQVYQADKGSYTCCNKKYGNTLSEEQFREEVSGFVYKRHSRSRQISQAIVNQVQQLKNLIIHQDRYRYFGCSVLIIYEGTDCALENSAQLGACECCDGEENVTVKIIDFAHASAVELQGSDGVHYEGMDKGFVHGLDNIVNLLRVAATEESKD